jgi:hypothetical protein
MPDSEPSLTVDDAVDAWHASAGSMSLQEWLGLTDEQYAAWVQLGTLPVDYDPPKRGT